MLKPLNLKGDLPSFALLNSDEGDQLEWVLAVARLILAACWMLAIYFDPEAVADHIALAYLCLIAYTFFSLTVLVGIRRKPAQFRSIRTIHVIDVASIVLLSALGHRVDSPFFMVFTFSVFCAAARWGFPETLITGTVLWGALFTERIFFGFGGFPMLSIYFWGITLLLACVAEGKKRIHEEMALLGRILQLCQLKAPLTPTVLTCLRTVGEFYRATEALIFIQENNTLQIFKWQYRVSDKMPASAAELSPAEGQKYLFQGPAPIWFWKRHRQKDCLALEVDKKSRGVSRLRFTPPDTFLETVDCDSMLAATFVFGEDLAGRVYILNPRRRWLPDRGMRYLLKLSSEIGPIAHNVYLWRRIRSKVRIVEQARAAREIHDGVIQTFIGLGLEIEALLMRNEPDSASRRQLERIQRLLREESQDLRDLMNRMRTPALTPFGFVDFLKDLVKKFGYETGIKSQFVCKTELPLLASKTCHEIVSIVREGLVNVRKHSGAKQVVVTLSSDQKTFKVAIEDDGSGSRLSGWRYDTANPEQTWEPAIIRERVLLLKGTLTVESCPGSGARVTAMIPLSQSSEWWSQQKNTVDDRVLQFSEADSREQ